MSLRSAVLALAATLLLTACAASGTPAQRTTPEPRPTAPVRTTAGGESLLTCGGGAFAASAMVEGIEPLTPRVDIAGALDELVRSAGMDAPLGLSDGGVQPGEWKVLAEDEGSLTIATGPWGEQGPAARAHVVGLEQHGDGWRAAGWGDCQLRPVLTDAVAWATVRASVADLDPDATAIPVRVTEQECASARDPEPPLREPVVETEESVTVYWTTEPATGAQKCPGNPMADRVVELDEPLGDRTMLDGSTWPATPVTQLR